MLLFMFAISTRPSSSFLLSFFLLKYFTILQKMNKTLLGPLKLSLISFLAGNPRVAQFFDLLQYRWVHLHGWTYYFIDILIGSSVVPVVPAVLWARATAAGMISGVVGGCVCGIISWLSFASTYDGGLSPQHFIENTGRDFPMLVGNLTSICVGGLLCTIVTVATRKSMSKAEVEEEWEKTRGIDTAFIEEMGVENNKHERPSQNLIDKKFQVSS